MTAITALKVLCVQEHHTLIYNAYQTAHLYCEAISSFPHKVLCSMLKCTVEHHMLRLADRVRDGEPHIHIYIYIIYSSHYYSMIYHLHFST